MNCYEVKVLFPDEPEQRFRRLMARSPANAVEKAIKQVMARAGGSSRQYPVEMCFQVKLVAEMADFKRVAPVHRKRVRA